MKEFYIKNAITYGNRDLTEEILRKFMRQGLVLKCFAHNVNKPFTIYYDKSQDIFVFDNNDVVEELKYAYSCFSDEENKIEVIRPLISRILTLKD